MIRNEKYYLLFCSVLFCSIESFGCGCWERCCGGKKSYNFLVVDFRKYIYKNENFGTFKFSSFGANLAKGDVPSLKNLLVEKDGHLYSLSLCETMPSIFSPDAVFMLGHYSPFYKVRKFGNAYFFEEQGKEENHSETKDDFFDGYIFLFPVGFSSDVIPFNLKENENQEEEIKKKKLAACLDFFLKELDKTVRNVYKNKHFIFFIDDNNGYYKKFKENDEVVVDIKQMVDEHNKECSFFSKSPHKWDIVYSMKEFQELF